MAIENQAPRLIQGDCAVDDRGTLVFINDFHFNDVKRFYVVTNHRAGFIRAWHGHRYEAKYITVLQGAALVGAVQIDNWEQPSKEAFVHRYILSGLKPAILYIPPCFANGFMTLTLDAIIVFFSTATLEESRNDDFRFPARYWDIWEVEER